MAGTNPHNKRQAGGSGGAASSSMSRADRAHKRMQVAADLEAAEAAKLVPETEHQQHERAAAMAALQNATDLPSSYAALVTATAAAYRPHTQVVLTATDATLLDNARLAVPYLLYKVLVEHCTRPRTMRGLAFSSMKAQTMAQTIVATHGASLLRGDDLTVQDLMNCVDAVDAQKLLPVLQDVSAEARTQLLTTKPDAAT